MSQLSYDPHGKRRNVDWTDANGSLPEYDINRGFTGHEHLDNVGLIHMNGRVYDPTLGRFISADPYVQFPESGQSLNRYSYVMNNPLSFSDPSGFGLFSFVKKLFKNKFFRAVVAVVAAYYGGLAVLNAIGKTALTFNTTLAGFIPTYTYSTGALIAAGATGGFIGGFIASGGHLKAGIQGAVVGGLSGAIGASGALASRTAKAVAHGVVGGAQSAVNGGKFLRGFASSFFTKQVSGRISGRFENNPVGGAFAAATVGGTASVIGGGKFANGAYTTAFQYLFNEVRKRSRSNAGSNGYNRGKSISPVQWRTRLNRVLNAGTATASFAGAVGVCATATGGLCAVVAIPLVVMGMNDSYEAYDGNVSGFEYLTGEYFDNPRLGANIDFVTDFYGVKGLYHGPLKFFGGTKPDGLLNIFTGAAATFYIQGGPTSD